MNARPAKRITVAVLSLLALPLLLAGCGNKGPLILPPKDIPVDPSTLPPGDNPNVAMPPAEATDSDAEPESDTPATPVPTEPTDEPSKGDDDGGRG
ncbi:LPS translocon maturation chaperone LptM [Lysobacter panacisoli]|uniref:Lipoprotein n=1 Tax=Lysobacter panacisoli TaxID=1255263 RepID=A0ABP9L4H8_9GAMM|nr:lipoprotein [Lysobacter panacisoli]